MLKVVFDSLTGLTEDFAKKVEKNSINIKDWKRDIKDKDKVFLISRSVGFGEIPKTTKEFLEDFRGEIIGTAISGNKNWGKTYGGCGRKIEELYKIPNILIFEGSGFKEDIKKIREFLKENER